MTTMDRWMRTLGSAMVICLLIAGSLLLMGSAVQQPPFAARGFEFSAATTLIANGTDTVVEFSSGTGPTASLLVINDNAGGGTDLLMSLSAVTAAAPASTAANTTFRVKPGNQINFDGRWVRAALRGDGGTVAARMIASY